MDRRRVFFKRIGSYTVVCDIYFKDGYTETLAFSRNIYKYRNKFYRNDTTLTYIINKQFIKKFPVCE